MRQNRFLILPVICAAIFTFNSGVRAKNNVFQSPRAFHAKTYPAHDSHDNEKFSVAADPYDMPDKASKIFSVDYKNNDLLPIYMIFSNDNDQPVSLAALKVTLITHKRVKLTPLDMDAIYRRITHPGRRPDEGRLPFPLPKKKRGLTAEVREEVENAQFMAKAVEPHGTQAGFFFFDIQDIDNPLAGAKLEVTGIADVKGQELFYFEIPMEKYLSYQPVHH